jgi:LysR family hydrogen peroxide-inducible transcriptional activator
MVSFRQLEYLRAIAEKRHFRHAAESVGVSQPTLSAQFAALEEELGVQLVERSRARVLMTPVGEEVVKHARRILDDVQELKDVAAGRTGQLGGVVRLGLPPTIGPYLLPPMIPHIHRDYPDLQLYVREEMPQHLPDQLQEGQHDIIISPIPVKAGDLKHIPLFREPLRLAISKDAALARKERILPEDLKGQSILTLESGHQLRTQLETICLETGAQLLSNYEGTSLDTLSQMVGMGMGLTFLPELYVKSAITNEQSVRITDLQGQPVYRTIGLLWRKTSLRRTEFQQFAERIRETVEDHFPTLTLI